MGCCVQFWMGWVSKTPVGWHLRKELKEVRDERCSLPWREDCPVGGTANAKVLRQKQAWSSGSAGGQCGRSRVSEVDRARQEGQVIVKTVAPTLSGTGSHWRVLHSAGTWPDLNSNGVTLATMLGMRGKGQSR